MELVGLFGTLGVMLILTIWGLSEIMKHETDGSLGAGLILCSPILIMAWVMLVGIVAEIIGCGIFGQAWIDGSYCRGDVQ